MIGVGRVAVTISTSYNGLRVGVAATMSSGSLIASCVVGDPSQPCGTEKVKTVCAPGSLVLGVTPTCAAAGVARPIARMAAMLTPDITRRRLRSAVVGVVIFVNSFIEV